MKTHAFQCSAQLLMCVDCAVHLSGLKFTLVLLTASKTQKGLNLNTLN